MSLGVSPTDHISEEFPRNSPDLDGCPDLSMLTHLRIDNILHNLRCRYAKNPFPDIYTNLGDVLIAINPYENLPIYKDDTISAYLSRAGAPPARTPHIFAVANRARQALLRGARCQSILMCGESGSGKTESAKHCLRFLTACCSATPGRPQPTSPGNIASQ
eukprot:51704_1